MANPDPNRHRNISFVKSLIRMIGFAVLTVDLVWGCLALILAEILGVVEESE